MTSTLPGCCYLAVTLALSEITTPTLRLTCTIARCGIDCTQAEKALVKLNERLEGSAPRPAAATNPFLAPPEEEEDDGSGGALPAGTRCEAMWKEVRSGSETGLGIGLVV